jgi:hypothetical protein
MLAPGCAAGRSTSFPDRLRHAYRLAAKNAILIVSSPSGGARTVDIVEAA